MTTADLQKLDRQCVWHPFTHMSRWLADDPLIIVRGDGAYLFDSDGRKYLDGTGSLWCNVHGHRVPEIDAAIRAQLDMIAHTTLLGLTNEPAVLLAEQLVRIAPPGLTKVFYSDSGATATEIAFKMAVQYWWNQGRGEKTEFIGLADAYHGDTVGAMSVGHTAAFHKPYQPLLFKVHYSPSPPAGEGGVGGIDFELRTSKSKPLPLPPPTRGGGKHALAAMEDILIQHADRIAAICIEPLVMGAAGMQIQPPGFVRGVRELATKYDVLLIADEVATGFGRTGTMFACEHDGVTPDLLCLGKGLSGGYLPMAATLATDQIFDAFLGEPSQGKTFFHGHTFTGNPLGCAAALASLELMQTNRLIQHVHDVANEVRQDLLSLLVLAHVGAVRQAGFMVGIDLLADKTTGQVFDPRRRVGADVCHRLRARGVLLRPLGDTIVINPPLITSAAQWREIIAAISTELHWIDPSDGVSAVGDAIISGDF